MLHGSDSDAARFRELSGPHGPNREQDAPQILGNTQRDLDAGQLGAGFFGLRPRARP